MDLRARIKEILTNDLMLDVKAEDIGDDAMLFGPDSGLGLDSVDALQLVVAIEKHFNLKIFDQAEAKKTLQSVSTIAQAIEAAQAQSQVP